jgi:hypothetical protein
MSARSANDGGRKILTIRVELEDVEVTISVRNYEMQLPFKGQEFSGYGFHGGSAFAEQHHLVWLFLSNLSENGGRYGDIQGAITL